MYQSKNELEKKETFKARSMAAFSTAGAFALTSGPVLALSEAQNTEVTAALDAGAVTVGLVVNGLIGLAALLTGFFIVYKLLSK